MRITSLTLETTTTSPTGAVELTFTPASRLGFLAGQAGLLRIPGGGVRPFTLSSDDRSEHVSIATLTSSGSRFKTALTALRPGDRVHALAALPTLPAISAEQSQVLIAQGIGITPFLAMARSHSRMDASLLQVGAAHYFDETSASMTSAEHHPHREGLAEAVTRALQQRPDAHWSLSGRSDFVNALAGQLRGAGVSSRRIHKAAFWTMKAPAAPSRRASTADAA